MLRSVTGGAKEFIHAFLAGWGWREHTPAGARPQVRVLQSKKPAEAGFLEPCRAYFFGALAGA
jgi:hypothetical protein